MFTDDAGDCFDASTEQPAACPSPGLDIRSIKLAPGSLRITYTVGAPGLPSLAKAWRAYVDVDVDGNRATGAQRFLNPTSELMGSDLHIEAKATGGPMGEATATASVWDANGSITDTFTEAEGVTAAWTTDTTLEIVVPDVALAAVSGSVRPASYRGDSVPIPKFDLILLCLEDSTDTGDFADCVRKDKVDVEGAGRSIN